MDLNDLILQHAKENACILGEALLAYAFVGEGRGCYSNFKLRDSFVPFPEGIEKYADYLLGLPCPDNTDEDMEIHREELSRISCFIDSKKNLKVAWFWDGDGHLIFEGDDFFIENSDIKNSYRWRNA